MDKVANRAERLVPLKDFFSKTKRTIFFLFYRVRISFFAWLIAWSSLTNRNFENWAQEIRCRRLNKQRGIVSSSVTWPWYLDLLRLSLVVGSVMSVFSKTSSLHLSFIPFYWKPSLFHYQLPLPDYSETVLGARSETSREFTVRSNLWLATLDPVRSPNLSNHKQPWTCPVLGWGPNGEAHVLSKVFFNHFFHDPHSEVRAYQHPASPTMQASTLPTIQSSL